MTSPGTTEVLPACRRTIMVFCVRDLGRDWLVIFLFYMVSNNVTQWYLVEGSKTISFTCLAPWQRWMKDWVYWGLLTRTSIEPRAGVSKESGGNAWPFIT